MADRPPDELLNRVTWRIPNALVIIGSRAGDEWNGMTASWVTQVSMAPVLIGVGIDNTAVTHRLITAGGSFTVNLWSAEETKVFVKFSKPAAFDPEALTLNGRNVRAGTTGAPVFVESVAVSGLRCPFQPRLRDAHVLRRRGRRRRDQRRRCAGGGDERHPHEVRRRPAALKRRRMNNVSQIVLGAGGVAARRGRRRAPGPCRGDRHGCPRLPSTEAPPSSIDLSTRQNRCTASRPGSARWRTRSSRPSDQRSCSWR